MLRRIKKIFRNKRSPYIYNTPYAYNKDQRLSDSLEREILKNYFRF